MNQKALYLIVFILLIFTKHLQAQVIVISDMDDTIKITGVKTLYFPRYLIDTESYFLGMGELLQTLKSETQSQFFYVSNAPKDYIKSNHLEILKNSDSPEGEYLPRYIDYPEGHKVHTISQIIEEQHPKVLILIGDNGERDPLVYKTIQAKYKHSGIQFFQFIRRVYSNKKQEVPIYKDQYEFVTPVEVAGILNREGIINDSSFDQLSNLLTDRILLAPLDESDGELAFVQWQDCSEYYNDFWDFYKNDNLNPNTVLRLTQIEDLIQRRCSGDW